MNRESQIISRLMPNNTKHRQIIEPSVDNSVYVRLCNKNDAFSERGGGASMCYHPVANVLVLHHEANGFGGRCGIGVVQSNSTSIVST